jgi:hypothetical protein
MKHHLKALVLIGTPDQARQICFNLLNPNAAQRRIQGMVQYLFEGSACI